MSKSAPRNIGMGSLMHYRFPVMAIASILHRASGVLLFLYIPFMLWFLHKAIAGPMSFNHLQMMLATSFCLKFFTWLWLSAVAYHLIAGVKHLFMDLGHFETKGGGRVASYIVMLLALIVVVLLGIWLW